MLNSPNKSLLRKIGALPLLAALVTTLCTTADESPPKTGAATERRFPPLKLPKGFKATLFACDPLIEYPSVISVGPKANSLFVAIDYMTGLGTEIVRRDEIRLLEDNDGDGYADKSTVYASGFNSIQGLAFHDGALYVMHAPFLTVLRDTDGDGKADQRKDLLTGLGLKPEDNPPRLHCANGVVVGHDGWLYLALGDHGCDVKRPEGDRLILQGGGILRCRPDGRDLHIFASGLRNIYDIALDEDLNVFVRDNENDGGDYMVRVCHSFFGADHGYPYLYDERPDEALPPLADLGRGSSAGSVCYLETAFPPEYRGNLFFCEWGRSVVRCQPKRAACGFAPLKEIEFAAGNEKDPYGFKPTDLVVDRDGALFVSDWCDGQRPKRGRGRIYRITSSEDMKQKTGAEKPGTSVKARLGQLDADSYTARCEAQTALERGNHATTSAVAAALKGKNMGVRGRMHAIWLLARTVGQGAHDDLVAVAKSDPEPRVRAQAVRALADIWDPVLTNHHLAAGRESIGITKKLAALADGQDPRVLLEVVLALGRMRWEEAPAWLAKHVTKPDAALAHAAMQTMRRADNWPAVLKLLDEPEPIRTIALRAVADQANATIVDGLIERLGTEKNAVRRRDYADALTRVYKKPGPWTYWGYRPPPRQANTVSWERTDAIASALDQMLSDNNRSVRLAILQRMQREKIPTKAATLSQWLREENDGVRGAVLLDALRVHPSAEYRELLGSVIGETRRGATLRKAALALYVQGLDGTSEEQLLSLAGKLEDGPILADTIWHLSKRPKLKAAPLLLAKLGAADVEVRAAALEAAAELQVKEAAEKLPRLLKDGDPRVRAAAATFAGKLTMKSASEDLLRLAKDEDAAVRRASLDALRRLGERRAIPLAVAGLDDPAVQVVALECLSALGQPAHALRVVELARRSPSADILPRSVALLSKWSEQTKGDQRDKLEQAIAELHGTSGVLARWRLAGFPGVKLDEILKSFPLTPKKNGDLESLAIAWQTAIGSGPEARVRPQAAKDLVWLAVSDVVVPEPTAVQFLAGSNGPLRLWVNGKLVHERAEARSFAPDADRFDATLSKGVNRVVVQAASVKGQTEFHARFRKKSANHEPLIQAALSRSGDIERGRKLFLDVGKSQCMKCHRLGEQGEKIGPDLTGVGKRFARVYLIESILEPSRTIAPSYETLLVELKDGRVVTGTRVVETPESLTLGDNQGKKHVLAKIDIESVRVQPVSTMPEGLERPLTADEFVDLIAFLVSQK